MRWNRTKRWTLAITMTLAAATGATTLLAADAAFSGAKVGLQVIDGRERGVGRLVADVAFTDLAGKRQTLSALTRGHKATVIALTDTSCPLCKKYAPTLVAMEKEWSSRGVAFLFVNLDTAADEGALRQAVKAIGFTSPYVHDRDAAIGRAVGARTTTEVFVLDAARTLVYRGAVDDQYGLGYSQDSPRATPLADTLGAVISGGVPTIGATTAPGCVVSLEGESAKPQAAAALPGALPGAGVTYHNRISRIVQSNCVECHRKGGIAPFSLETYKDVVAKRGMIEYVLENNVMPPWFAGKDSLPMRNDRSLIEDDKRDLLAWATGDHVEGDKADAPLPRVFPGADGDTWAIGKPDVIYELPYYVDVKAKGVMPYVNLSVATGLTEERWVQAVEIKPTAPSVVHHVLVHIAGDLDKGFLAAYVPGNDHVIYPEGLAKRLPANGTLHFQMHYTPTGTAARDRTRIGIKFAAAPPVHEVLTHGIANHRIAIPAGADNHKEQAWRPIPTDLTVLSFMPHMHVRGKSFKYEATLADGSTINLLDLPRYDFNWQLRYELAEPYVLPRGSRITATGWYDNSANNPANPDATKEIKWGPQTYDEMLIGYVEFYVNNQVINADGQTTKPAARAGLLQRLRELRKNR